MPSLLLSAISTAVLAVLLLAPARPGVAHQDIDEAILAAEMSAASVSVQRSRSLGASVTSVTFDAFGQTFILDLVPSSVVPSDTVVLHVHEHGVEELRAGDVFYTGSVRGKPGSLVAVSVSGDALEGIVRVEGEMYLVGPAETAAGEAGGEIVAYRLTDPFAGPSIAGDALLRQRDGGGATNGLQYLLEIAMVADHEFFLKHGANAGTRMLSVLNLVDAIYVDQIAVNLSAIASLVFETAGDPFSNFQGPSLFTNYKNATTEFGTYRNGAGGDIKNAGLGHLFSNRDLTTGGTGVINAGFGFFSSLCSATRGVSISTAPSVSASWHALIVAHEFGHNFGAEHDGVQGESCPDAPGGFIMAPSTTGNAFSDCSKAILIAGRDSANCIDEFASTTTTTTLPPPLCGDANGNGSLATTDALITLKAAVGGTPCALCVCDVNNSAGLSTTDALIVLKKAVGTPGIVLNCPAC